MKKITIEIKKSKRTGFWYWVMKGANGEKMAHSEVIQNRTYLKALMKRFADMGFVVKPYVP